MRGKARTFGSLLGTCGQKNLGHHHMGFLEISPPQLAEEFSRPESRQVEFRPESGSSAKGSPCEASNTQLGSLEIRTQEEMLPFSKQLLLSGVP